MPFSLNRMNSITTGARLIIWAVLLCTCLPVFADSESIHLQLRWRHQFQFAGYYAALEKGYYKKAGLNVIIHNETPGKMPINEALHGYRSKA